MNDRKYLPGVGILGLLLILSWGAMAQCPATDFTAPSTYCKEGTFQLTNTSESGSYTWDFCVGDLANTPTAAGAFTVSAANGRPGLELAKDGSVWYGFLTGTYSNTLTRLTLGNGLDQPPTYVENLGDLGGMLNGPGEIRLFREGNNWYGLLLNTTSGELLRLSLGDHLTNTISTTVLKSGLAYVNSGMAVGRDATDGWVATITTSANQLVILRLGSDIHSPGTADSLATPVFAGANNLGSVDLMESCGTWHGLTSNFGNGELYALNFGTQLFSLPTVTDILTLPVANPGKVRLADDGDSFYGLVTSIDGHYLELAFGNDLTTTPTVTDEGDMGGVLSSTLYGLGVSYDQSNWNAWVVDASSGVVFRIHYPDNCTISSPNSTSSDPIVAYEGPGTFAIGLKNATGTGTGRVTHSVTIASSTAPDIAFVSTNICAQHPVDFVSENTSGNITSYQWDFGDSGSSSGQNPMHTYTSAGSFLVKLQVDASNGCTNLALDSIRTYNQPVASFTLPPVSPYCTNQEYLFANTSTVDGGSPVTWQWQVDGADISSSPDLSFEFSGTASVDVKLVASLPGCFDEHTENIATIFPGPAVDFSFSGQCQNAPVSFTNQTAGTVDGYAWDFGDTATSSQSNPSHTYTVNDTYDVTLTASTTDGCENFKTQTLPVYQQPQPDFTLELPPFSCNGSPTQFDDATPNPTDSNIALWDWNFGDTGPGNTASTQNPPHTYADAGDYVVSLQTTTDAGCSKTIQKTMTIQAAPTVDFSNSPACANQPASFTNQSGSTLVASSWQIDGSFYSSTDATHTFTMPGDYPVTLSVTGDNNCIAETTRVITVPALPSLDFDYISNCAGFNATFTNASVSVADPVEETEWTFEGTSNSGNPASHLFAATGNTTVVMNTTTASGCVYQFQKTVSIEPAPHASFSVPYVYGASPFPVSFTNTSTNADTYRWNFGDKANSTSLQESPSFTFNDLGDYEVSLVASSDAGCADTVRKAIHVIPGEKDIALSDLRLIAEPDGSMGAMVSVTNHGNVPMYGLTVSLDLSTATIPETMERVLLPGEATDYTFEAHFMLTARHTFVCVRTDDSDDLHPEDNTACITLDDPVAFHAHPNPAGEKLVVDWIGTGTSEVSIRLVDLRGQLMADARVEGRPGYNQYVIQTATLVSGLYLLDWQMGNIRKISRIFVQH